MYVCYVYFNKDQSINRDQDQSINCITRRNSDGYNPNEEAPTVWAYLHGCQMIDC